MESQSSLEDCDNWAVAFTTKHPSFEDSLAFLECIFCYCKDWKIAQNSRKAKKLELWLVKTFKPDANHFLTPGDVDIALLWKMQKVIGRLQTTVGGTRDDTGSSRFAQHVRCKGIGVLSHSDSRSDLMSFVARLDPRNKLPKYAAEVKCTKCNQNKFITPLAIQNRKADEMQLMMYECSNHTPPFRWKV